MRSLSDLYRIGKENSVQIDLFPLQARESLAIMDDTGSCYIAIDPDKLRNEADEKHKLAHELGHCLTGSFYNRYSPFGLRQQLENRADRWAIHNCLPEAELTAAIEDGLTEWWQLSEHFSLPASLIKKAVCLYTYGNLAVEYYV